jgi:hypothetical protein
MLKDFTNGSRPLWWVPDPHVRSLYPLGRSRTATSPRWRGAAGGAGPVPPGKGQDLPVSKGPPPPPVRIRTFSYRARAANTGSQCFRAEHALRLYSRPGKGLVTPRGHWTDGANLCMEARPQPTLNARRP